MKITVGFLLFCAAVVAAATPGKHHAGHRRNARDIHGEGSPPGQQLSGDSRVIGSPDDETEARRLPSDDNGSQKARHGFGAPQALRNSQEVRHGYGGSGISNNGDVVESGSSDSIGQTPTRPFQNEGNNEGAEHASNVGQPRAYSGDSGRLGNLTRGYRSGYRPRVPRDHDSRSSEEDRRKYRRRYRPRVDDSRSSEESTEYGRRDRPRFRSDDDSRSSEESSEYGKRYRPWFTSDDDSRSSEESPEYGRRYRPRARSDDDSSSNDEDRPRWRERRQYLRRSDGEGEVRQFGQRRRAALAGFDRSG